MTDKIRLWTSLWQKGPSLANRNLLDKWRPTTAPWWPNGRTAAGKSSVAKSLWCRDSGVPNLLRSVTTACEAAACGSGFCTGCAAVCWSAGSPGPAASPGRECAGQGWPPEDAAAGCCRPPPSAAPGLCPLGLPPRSQTGLGHSGTLGAQDRVGKVRDERLWRVLWWLQSLTKTGIWLIFF